MHPEVYRGEEAEAKVGARPLLAAQKPKRP